MRVHRYVDFTTPLAPDRVVAALIDFSANRLEIWPGLDAEKYFVYELGETCALVREGTHSPHIWVRERYDWSQPGTVSWTLEESDVFAPGTVIRVTVGAANAGSHVEIDAVRMAASPVGCAVVMALKLVGRRFLLSSYKATFDRLARTDA